MRLSSTGLEEFVLLSALEVPDFLPEQQVAIVDFFVFFFLWWGKGGRGGLEWLYYKWAKCCFFFPPLWILTTCRQKNIGSFNCAWTNKGLHFFLGYISPTHNIKELTDLLVLSQVHVHIFFTKILMGGTLSWIMFSSSDVVLIYRFYLGPDHNSCHL